jgi:tetratricopeptide (TPR) repeat protein
VFRTRPVRRIGRPVVLLLWLSLASLAATLSIQKISSFDYWWALRTGKLILETVSIPTADPYSFTALGARWIDIHWIHQLGLYLTYLVGGHTGVVVAKMIFVFATMFVMATVGYRRDRPIVTVVALALMLLMASNRFMARPELPSFLLFAVVLSLHERFSRTGDRWVYVIVGIQLLWANVHGLFALGIVASGFYLLAEIAHRWTSSEKSFRPDRLKPLATVAALSVLVSTINPNFIDGALYPIQQLGMIGAGREKDAFGIMIVELLPLFDPIASPPAVVMAIVLTTAGLSLAAMLLNWRRIDVVDPLLWVAFVYLTLSAQRNRALLGIVAAAILTKNLQGFFDRHPLPARTQNALALLVSVLLLGVASDVASGRFHERTGSSGDPGFGIQSLHYPEAAVDWIAAHAPPGPIAHDMSDGGYLIWRLYPEYSAMSDGRLEIYGSEKFLQLQDLGPENFSHLDEQYHFGTVLISYSRVSAYRLIEALNFDPGWELTFVDDVALLFVRVPEAGKALYLELDVNSPDLFPPLGNQQSRRDQLRRIRRAGFYYGIHLPQQALRIWEEAIALYPEILGRYPNHAIFLRINGRYDEAEAVLQEWIRKDPSDADRHAFVADHYRSVGKLSLARIHYDTAIRLDSDQFQSLMQRAFLFEQDGDYQQALALYQRIVDRLHAAVPVAAQASQRIELMRAKIAEAGDADRP